MLGSYREFVEELAEAKQVDVAGPAMLFLVALGAAAAKAVRVQWSGSDYHHLNLYVLIAAPSSDGKSPVMADLLKPFDVAQADLAADGASERNATTVARHIAEQRYRDAVRRAAKAQGAEEEAITVEATQHQKRALALAPRPVPRLFTDDATVEALARKLGENRGKLAIFSDEGSTVFANASRTVLAGVDGVEVILKAHSASTIVVDRATSESIVVSEPVLSIGITTQMRTLATLTRRESFLGRGLWERFMTIAPASRVGQRSPSAAPVARSLEIRYAATIHSLLRLPIFERSTDESEALTLGLSSGAREALEAFFKEIDTRMGPGRDLSSEAIKGWAGKVRTNVIRIAGILHVADNETTVDALKGARIDRETAERAVRIMRYALAHALRLFGPKSLLDDDIALVIEWLRAEGRPTFTERELHRAKQARFPRVEFIAPAIEALVAAGVIRAPQRAQAKAGRPSGIWEVHPDLIGASPDPSGPDGAPSSPPRGTTPGPDTKADVRGDVSSNGEAGTRASANIARKSDEVTLASGDDLAETTSAVTEPTPLSGPRRVHLPLADAYGRDVDDHVIRREVERGAWRPFVVLPEVSGLTREMTIMLATRKTDLIKWDFHGDKDTFCPPIWADFAIGSGACGFGCRSCFLMLTFRAMRDPLRPVVYDNGDDFERAARKWLSATHWDVEYGVKDRRRRTRTHKDSIGLGIDCSDSLLLEGVTGHARRLIPLFTDPRSNPLGNPLILLTKSANTHYLAQLKDSELRRVNGRIPNVSITMSLNPEGIADLWEGKYPDTMQRITPPISRRLEALRFAQDLGFDVRLRVDPIMTPHGWELQYTEFFDQLAHRYGLRPSMITLGSHREKNATLDKFRSFWGLPEMEWEAETTTAREGTHHHMVGREDVYRRVRDMIGRAFNGTGVAPWVSLCKETHEVRRATDMCNANCNCLPQTDAPNRRLPIYREPSTTPCSSADDDADAGPPAVETTVERATEERAHVDGPAPEEAPTAATVDAGTPATEAPAKESAVASSPPSATRQPRRARRRVAEAPTAAELASTRQTQALDPFQTPVTTVTWPTLVAAVIAGLPEPMRSRITFGAVETIPGTVCSTCGGSTFGNDDTCVKCEPSARGRRRNLADSYRRLVIAVDDSRSIALAEYPSLGHAGLSAGLATSGRAHPVLTLPNGEFLVLNERVGHCPFSSVTVFTEMFTSLLRGEFDRTGGSRG
ncbi:MAG: DUF3987 domain-containing protein [Polyangiales bacterium]